MFVMNWTFNWTRAEVVIVQPFPPKKHHIDETGAPLWLLLELHCYYFRSLWKQTAEQQDGTVSGQPFFSLSNEFGNLQVKIWRVKQDKISLKISL